MPWVGLVVVDVVVVDRLVLDRSLFSVMNSLQLMTIGQVSMVSGRDDIVFVVRFSSQELVFGGGFEMMCSCAVMFGCVVMNFVFVCGCHRDLSILIEWSSLENPRARTNLALTRFVPTQYRVKMTTGLGLGLGFCFNAKY